MESHRLKHYIKKRAKELGFHAIGVSRVSAITSGNLQQWLARGFHGQMHYLERNLEKRLEPDNVLPSARSIVSVGLNYLHPFQPSYRDPSKGVISRYARGFDYHEVLEKRLSRMLKDLQDMEPSVEGRFYVDTGPVMEKYWATQSGIGWLGKHTNVVSRENGSWFFIGEILLNVDLSPDLPVRDFCGSCTRCIDACPTHAIVEPYVLDSRRCISYLTIEHRGDICKAFGNRMGNLIFGCDICQDVCPWNSRAPWSFVEEFRETPREYDLVKLAGLSPGDFQKLFSKSPVRRAKWRGFMRNVAVALGNSGLAEATPGLTRMLNCDDGMVRRHAARSLAGLTRLVHK